MDFSDLFIMMELFLKESTKMVSEKDMEDISTPMEVLLKKIFDIEIFNIYYDK